MNVSLNEIEAIGKKSARGAGYSWGLAEEAAKNIRWLCARGFDGCGQLAELLRSETGSADRGVLLDGNVWKASGGSLCPIATGASISDMAQDLPDTGWHLIGVDCPMLLIPFLAALSEKTGHPIAMEADGSTVLIENANVAVTGALKTYAERVVVQKASDVPTPCPLVTRAHPTDPDWAELQRLAHRTYAPATAASRLKGAGAGETDND